MYGGFAPTPYPSRISERWIQPMYAPSVRTRVDGLALGRGGDDGGAVVDPLPDDEGFTPGMEIFPARASLTAYPTAATPAAISAPGQPQSFFTFQAMVSSPALLRAGPPDGHV